MEMNSSKLFACRLLREKDCDENVMVIGYAFSNGKATTTDFCWKHRLRQYVNRKK